MVCSKTAILALISGCLAAAPAVAQDALTTRQMVALSVPAATRTIRRDLLSILEPSEGISSGMLRSLRGVALTTRAFETEVQGVCRRDMVSLHYASTEPGTADRDTPIRPYSIEAEAQFHIQQLPLALREGASRRLPWSAACERASRDNTAGWFPAKTPVDAAQSAQTLLMAVDGLKAGTLKSQPCKDHLVDSKMSCEQAILDVAKVSNIMAVQSCPAQQGLTCFSIDLMGMTTLTIVAKIAPEALAPTGIESISVEQFIIVT